MSNSSHDYTSRNTAPPSSYHSLDTSSHLSANTSSYRSAESSSYYSARSSYHSSRLIANGTPSESMFRYLAMNRDSDPGIRWAKLLFERDLIPSFAKEQNWSGRGQHAQFDPSEESAIPLKFEKVIGHSQTAIVQSVLCRRVRLACKTMRCSRKMRREDIVSEVEHLQKLQHAHVIRLIGTYICGNMISLLLYPVADYHLGEFMDTIFEELPVEDPVPEEVALTSDHLDIFPKQTYLKDFFFCLLKAMEYIHKSITKHMDIKPQNILVRKVSKGNGWIEYKVYIADFGISRSYKSISESVTESPISFTRTYAAPEVHRQESRGLSADIFSLGCVFAEMLAAVAQSSRVQEHEQQPLFRIRSQNTEDQSYQANITPVTAFLQNLRFQFIPHDMSHVRDCTIQMLAAEPDKRMTASECTLHLATLTALGRISEYCCTETCEPLELAEGIYR